MARREGPHLPWPFPAVGCQPPLLPHPGAVLAGGVMPNMRERPLDATGSGEKDRVLAPWTPSLTALLGPAKLRSRGLCTCGSFPQTPAWFPSLSLCSGAGSVPSLEGRSFP